MPKKFSLLLVLVLFHISSFLFAQLSSPAFDFKVATAYSTHDSIFIFNQSPSAKKGTLTAVIPGGGAARFEWSAYDTATRVFSPAFLTEDNVSVSTASNLAAGGYRVHVTKPGLDTIMTGWVFLNDFTFSVEKNNAGEVHFFRRTCEFTNLQANGEATAFKYFNPENGARLTLQNSLKIVWSSSTDNESTFAYSGLKIWIEGDDLPSEDTDYTARATDNFELWKEDKVKYISIIPKVKFEKDYEKKYEESGSESSSGSASAPLEVTFKNNSKNTVKYTWIFGDGDTIYLKEPDNTPEPHIYFQSDKRYYLKLIAESKEGCVREDTSSIYIDKSVLEIPNVFTPNDANGNDVFRIYNLSLREFHITIYSRSGRKVYEYHGPDINNWEGWNGKMGNSDASAGVYFYVVEAISWELPAKKYKPTKHSGFVYLIRD